MVDGYSERWLWQQEVDHGYNERWLWQKEIAMGWTMVIEKDGGYGKRRWALGMVKDGCGKRRWYIQ